MIREDSRVGCVSEASLRDLSGLERRSKIFGKKFCEAVPGQVFATAKT